MMRHWLMLLSLVTIIVGSSAGAITLFEGDVLVNAPVASRVTLPGGGLETIVPGSPNHVVVSEIASHTTTDIYILGSSSDGFGVYRVDPMTMTAPLLVALPPSHGSPTDLAVDARGRLLVLAVNQLGETLYLIDPVTLEIRVVFENTTTSGPLPGQPIRGIGTLDAETVLLAARGPAGTFGTGGIYSFFLPLGTVTPVVVGGLISDYEDIGVYHQWPFQVVSRFGQLFVGTAGSFGGYPNWTVVRVDPSTGLQRRLASGGYSNLWHLDLSLDARTVYATTRPGRLPASYSLLAIDANIDNGSPTIVASGFVAATDGNGSLAVVEPPASSGQIIAPPSVLNNNATTDSGTDIFPQISNDGGAHWVSIWQSSENLGGTIGTDFDILTARSSDDGETWSAPAVLNTNGSSDNAEDDLPGLTNDGAGNWIAVWRSNNDLGGTIGTDWDILFSRSTDNGTTWSPPAPLNSYAAIDSGTDDRPVISSDGDTFLAAWGSNDGALGPDYDIRVSRSTDGGATWSTSTPLNSGADVDSANDEHPFLAPDGSGNWIAVWESDSSALGGDGDILVARSADGGSTWSAPVPLNTNASTDAGKDAWPRVENDGLGTWVAGWESDENLAGTIGIDRDIFFARSTNEGATWTDPAALNSNAFSDAGDDANPDLTNDGAGNWIAVWDSGATTGGTGTDVDILTARSTNGGATWSDAAPFNRNALGDSGGDYNPRIATQFGGPSVVVWHSEENLMGTAGTDWDIFVAITTPIDRDSDLDSIFNAVDNCPTVANPGQEDSDLDLIGDACDPFPNDTCNYIGMLPRSTATLVASQDNSCENWSGHSQPGSNLQSAVLRKADLRA